MDSPPMKEAVVVVVDVGTGVSALSEEDHEALRSCVAEQFWRKMMFTTQDEMAIVLAGAAQTHNALNQNHPNEYKNLAVLRNLSTPSAEHLQAISNFPIGGERMDVVEALILAADLLHQRVGTKRFKKRVFLYTAAMDECTRKDDLDSVVNAYANQDIRLDVVGVSFCFKNKEAADAQTNWETLTDKQQNEKVLYHIIDSLRSHKEAITAANKKFHYHLCNSSSLMLMEDAVQTLMTEASKKVRLTTLANCTFDFGDEKEHNLSLRIPIKLYTKTMLTRPPSLKASSKKARLDADAVDPSVRYEVEIDRRYFHCDDDELEVDKDSAVKAYRYGNTAVPFNEIDERMLDFDGGLKAIKVLAFVPRKSVKRHHMRSNVLICSTASGDLSSEKSFIPFVEAMFETDMAVILRVVKRDAKAPTINLGWAHITRKKKCLLMTELPFCEDIRKFDFLPFSEATLPRKEHLRAAEQLINNMDLMDVTRVKQRKLGQKQKREDAEAEAEEEEEEEEGVMHRYTFNPAVQYMTQCIRERVLKPDRELPPPEDRILQNSLNYENETNSLYPFLEAAMPSVQGFDKVCATKVNLAAQKNKEAAEKKNFWFAGNTTASGPVLTTVPALQLPPPEPLNTHHTSFRSERSKPDPDATQYSERTLAGASSASVLRTQNNTAKQDLSLGGDFLASTQDAAKRVDHVTTISPVEDFQNMVGRRDGDFLQAAFAGVKSVAKQLVMDSVGTQFYEKAFGCVVALRAVCVREEEATVFNDWLREMKLAFAYGKKAPFWTMVSSAHITLISAAETSSSNVTPEEAKIFLNTEAGLPSQAVLADQDKDADDDMFGALS